jgi:hypothetical protein
MMPWPSEPDDVSPADGAFRLEIKSKSIRISFKMKEGEKRPGF